MSLRSATHDVGWSLTLAQSRRKRRNSRPVLAMTRDAESLRSSDENNLLLGLKKNSRRRMNLSRDANVTNDVTRQHFTYMFQSIHWFQNSPLMWLFFYLFHGFVWPLQKQEKWRSIRKTTTVAKLRADWLTMRIAPTSSQSHSRFSFVCSTCESFIACVTLCSELWQQQNTISKLSNNKMSSLQCRFTMNSCLTQVCF